MVMCVLAKVNASDARSGEGSELTDYEDLPIFKSTNLQHSTFTLTKFATIQTHYYTKCR